MSSRDSIAARDTELGSSKCMKSEVFSRLGSIGGLTPKLRSAPALAPASESKHKLRALKAQSDTVSEPQVILVRSEKSSAIDYRLVDLAILIAEELPRMNLVDVLSKVRDEATWKSYLVYDASMPSHVLGGCVVKEHNMGMAELSLMAVRTDV